MENKNKVNRIFIAVVIASVYIVVFLLEQVMPANHMLFTVLKKGSIFALVGVSMNLLNGFTGLFSLGQAGFMLIGAYAYGILTIPPVERAAVYQYFDGGIVQFALPVLVALVISGLAAAGFSALIGFPVLRLKSDYLAIATLGFAEIIRSIFQFDKLGPITNGSNLLRKFPTLNDFNITDSAGNVIIRCAAFIPLVISGICIAFIVLLINSSYGRVFKAIRDDEIAAQAMGVNLFHHKLLSYVISSFFAGVGGGLLTMYSTTVQANAFVARLTYEILLFVVIGGIGSITGSIIGSFLYVATLEWWLRDLDSGKFLGIVAPTLFRPGFRKVVFAVIVMLVVLLYRRGIMGDKEISLDFLFRKKRAVGKGDAVNE